MRKRWSGEGDIRWNLARGDRSERPCRLAPTGREDGAQMLQNPTDRARRNVLIVFPAALASKITLLLRADAAKVGKVLNRSVRGPSLRHGQAGKRRLKRQHENTRPRAEPAKTNGSDRLVPNPRTPGPSSCRAFEESPDVRAHVLGPGAAGIGGQDAAVGPDQIGGGRVGHAVIIGAPAFAASFGLRRARTSGDASSNGRRRYCRINRLCGI